MRGSLASRIVLVVTMIGIVGTACRRRHRVEIRYVPSGAPVPAFRANVFLQVLDGRPPDRGGLDPRRVGWVPGNYGIPKALRVPESAVAHNVWMATSDALAQVGIGSGAGPNELRATVLEFWEDGIGGSGSHVVVRYQLVDRSGGERWNATVESGSSAGGDPPPPEITPPPDSRSLGMFTYALARLTARARIEFAAPAFQQALAPAN